MSHHVFISAGAAYLEKSVTTARGKSDPYIAKLVTYFFYTCTDSKADHLTLLARTRVINAKKQQQQQKTEYRSS